MTLTNKMDQTLFVQTLFVHQSPQLMSIIPWSNNIKPKTSKFCAPDDENPSQPNAQ